MLNNVSFYFSIQYYYEQLYTNKVFIVFFDFDSSIK